MMPDHHLCSYVPVLKVFPAPCTLNHSSNPHNCCLALPIICPSGDGEYCSVLAPAKAEANWSWGVSKKLCSWLYTLWIHAVTFSLNPINTMFGRGQKQIEKGPRPQPSDCVALVGIGPCKVTPGNRETVNIKPALGSAGTPWGKSHCLYVTPAGHWCSALSYLLVLQDVKSHLAVNYRGWGEISHSLLTADPDSGRVACSRETRMRGLWRRSGAQWKWCCLLGVGFGSDGCFCFLHPAMRPEGGGPWSINGLRVSVTLQQTILSGRRRGVVWWRFILSWCESSAAHRTAQRHWYTMATLLSTLLICLCVSLCSQHMASPAISSGFQSALLWQVDCWGALFLGLQLELCLPPSLGGCGALLSQ